MYVGQRRGNLGGTAEHPVERHVGDPSSAWLGLAGNAVAHRNDLPAQGIGSRSCPSQGGCQPIPIAPALTDTYAITNG